MTPAECREAVRLMFAELYPKCKVIYSYPNAVRRRCRISFSILKA